ncbi:MAG: pyroglutamyl-peptidase I [Clostridia bacterium]|nr:pyroglutamyl-peptidase I [Clostridia bacterium]
MKKLLLTGFEPFGGERINPALEAVRSVKNTIGSLQIVKLQVPVVYREAGRVVCEAMEKEKPDAIICIGQAGGRDAVTPERVAINVMDAASPDNAGQVMTDELIETDGPAAYFATLPVKQMVKSVQEKAIPCRISNTAGTYVCNSLIYDVLHYARRNMPHVKACFIHVPHIPEQTQDKPQMPSLPLEKIVEAIEAIIENCL